MAMPASLLKRRLRPQPRRKTMLPPHAKAGPSALPQAGRAGVEIAIVADVAAIGVMTAATIGVKVAHAAVAPVKKPLRLPNAT